jgi:hypothetical protein
MSKNAGILAKSIIETEKCPDTGEIQIRKQELMQKTTKDPAKESTHDDWLCEKFDIKRLFWTTAYKGEPLYLSTQKKYEVLRTFLYFGISLTLFLTGLITVGSVRNLLSVVAVLGCLPASKSAVAMILYLRCRSISKDEIIRIDRWIRRDLIHLYDLFFTSYSKNYYIAHMVISNNILYAYAPDQSFPIEPFKQHLNGIFAADGYASNEIHIIIHRTLDEHCMCLRSLLDGRGHSDEKTLKQPSGAPPLQDIIYSVTL